MKRSGRLVILFVLGGLLGLVALADRSGGRDASFGFADREPFAMPVADPADALSSTWFCAGGTAKGDGLANVTVVIANPTDAPVTGTLTWVPSEGQPVEAPVEIPPLSRLDARASNRVQAPFVAAVVELDAGQVVVEHTVAGPTGMDAEPCSPAGSDRWYLAAGATTKDAVELLALFNPFPSDAIVDMTFATDQGEAAPEAVQGYVVPARSLRVVDLTQVVRRRATLAVTVATRTGRLIVDAIQTFDGSEGRKGLDLTLASPVAGREWYFPEGFLTDSVRERYHVYNPGDREALVELAFVTEGTEVPVEPLEVTVGPRSSVAIDAAENGVPAGVGHSSTVKSLNDRPVVVQRELAAGGDGARRGWSAAMGSRRSARAWVLAAGAATDEIDEWVVVQNPSPQPVSFSVAAIAGGQRLAIDGMQKVELGPAGRRALRLGDRIRRFPLPLLIEASGPVVVERDLYLVGGTGLSTTMGVPLG